MRIEFLDVDGNVVTTVDTTAPTAEFEYFAKMLPQIISWRDYAELTETLDEAKARYINTAKAYRDSQEVAPITYNGNTYDYDAKARERLLIARTAIEDAGGTGTIDWTMADQSRVTIGLNDFKGINVTAAARSNTLHVNYTSTKTALLAATSIEELEKIYPLGGE